ncbi:MAG: 5-formyltetrahydrofolate cyclo-ligase [Myxococcota bacterium]
MDDREAYLRGRVKQELRRRIRAVRKALPAEARAERSQAIATRALGEERIANARCVAGFVPIRGEVDPRPIVNALREREATIALPRVDYDEQRIVLHEYAGEELIRGAFGVFEPAATSPRVDLSKVDLVIVPGLAFDPLGHRVGYGKGYYDQLLPTLPHAFRVAVGYDFQLVSEVPAQAHDVPVHAIVTDARTLYAQSS